MLRGNAIVGAHALARQAEEMVAAITPDAGKVSEFETAMRDLFPE